MVTAKDLLYKALEYDAFWNSSKHIRNTQPSQLRKQQLNILLAHFGIEKKNVNNKKQSDATDGTITEDYYFITGRLKPLSRFDYIKSLSNIRYFTTGEFIVDRDNNLYHPFLRQISSTLKSIVPQQKEIIEASRANLKILFSDLYNFRLGIYHIFQQEFRSSSTNEFTIENQYYLLLKKKCIDVLQNSFAEIDDTLCLLIDPEKRMFSEEEINLP